jgi:hypothetical protein
VIVALMQPYFFPYIGYIQLMHAVDLFIVYDDVQYMKGGWINRNLIRIDGGPAWLTLPVHRDSLLLPINERRYVLDGGTRDSVRQRLRLSYGSAAHYDGVAPIIDGLLSFDDDNIARFNTNLLTELARALGLRCRIALSSAIAKPAGLKGEARVVDLCQRTGAMRYINPIGGMSLYNPAHFDETGIELKFLRTLVSPVQLDHEASHLSIIDTLMHHGVEGTKSLLTSCQLVGAAPSELPA